jgi:hypothetical protein
MLYGNPSKLKKKIEDEIDGVDLYISLISAKVSTTVLWAQVNIIRVFL